MSPNFDEPKRRFEAAKAEFVEAIHTHMRTHAEAMVTESKAVDDAYTEACADLDRKGKTYRDLATQLREAKGRTEG